MKFTDAQIREAKSTLVAYEPDQYAAMRAAGIDNPEQVSESLMNRGEVAAGFALGVMLTLANGQHYDTNATAEDQA